MLHFSNIAMIMAVLFATKSIWIKSIWTKSIW